MVKGNTFVLKNGRIRIVLCPLSDRHWEIVEGTGPFRPGDQVCATNVISFKEAKERVSRRSTRVSPLHLALLKGADEEKSQAEVIDLLTRQPWKLDPNPPMKA